MSSPLLSLLTRFNVVKKRAAAIKTLPFRVMKICIKNRSLGRKESEITKK